ncbi:MAG TPA: oligosaccharyl transferase, archaeosortase A system-associated, partial [Methanosarcina sp.]|nr:oligosaccharyl transferase, archaeosortase A system-associated [Methanosarcina sp.]
VIAGIMYSAYQLSWPGASLFAFIVLVYAVFQYILDNFNNESSDYLGFTGIITFLVSAILVLPFVHSDQGFSLYYYSWFHVVTALGAMIGFAALSFIERELKRRQMKAYYYPLLIFGLAIFGLLAARIVAPSFYSLIINTPNAIFGIQTGGPATIGEASSMFYLQGKFTFARVFGNFTLSAFIVSTLGIFALAAKIFKKPRIEEVFVLSWSLLILLTIYGQNRFGYYYSINVSILSAYMGGLLLDIVKWNELSQKFESTVKSTADVPGFFKAVRIDHIIALLVIAVILIYPVYGAAMEQSNGAGDPNTPWLEACMWLRSNTPVTGMDYNGIYQAPAGGGAFQYPAAAYGVMSWWDYGHYIETIGQRMPNANPFQAGIGGRRFSINEPNEPGAATFLTANSEENGSSVLEAIDPAPDKSGARYIVSDTKMATDIFGAMPEWTLDTAGYYQTYQTGNGYQSLPSDRYFKSMEARLHIFDANGLKQYRLVYETEAYPNQTQELGYKQVYNVFFEGNLSLVDTGYVKIFEYVKGANITGTAAPNEAVKISTTIKTDQGRTFEYSQSTTADPSGRYNFTVPYSTEGPISEGTQFKTAPTGPYILSYGGTTKEVRVNEGAVMKGEEIKV